MFGNRFDVCNGMSQRTKGMNQRTQGMSQRTLGMRQRTQGMSQPALCTGQVDPVEEGLDNWQYYKY